MEFMQVDDLWEVAKDTAWVLWDDEGEETNEFLSLQEALEEDVDHISEELQGNLDSHFEGISEYISIFERYKDSDGREIPKNYALRVYENGVIDDGNHRLVAAKILGLKYLPVEVI